MAGTIRRPLRRERRSTQQFSEAALTLFARIKALPKCSCAPTDSVNWLHRGMCQSCRTWRDIDGELWERLNLRTWEFPAVQRPGTKPANEEAQRRWRELEAALE
jgi:hypothetical protein